MDLYERGVQHLEGLSTCVPWVGFESRQELKSSSGYENEEGLKMNHRASGRIYRRMIMTRVGGVRLMCSWKDISEDDQDKGWRGQADVFMDEMLSDNYYEHDGDEHPSDLLHQGAIANLLKLKSKSRNVDANKDQLRKSKASNHDEFGDADADYEDGEDDAYENDPDDADLDPDITSERRRQKHD